jgi:serine/threonine-protein kinase HipA
MSTREGFDEVLSQDEQTILNLLSVGTSAGGAKPKALLAINDETKEVRSGQVRAPGGFHYWLFKFDGINPRGEQLTEGTQDGRRRYADHLTALDAGIDMTECHPFEEGGPAHFMTERFDRDADGEKIRMQALMALNHFPGRTREPSATSSFS